jgi:hypothetical protein
MFKLNSHMIQKMGWFLYHPSIGLGFDLPGIFHSDPLVRFFFIDKSKNKVYIIKEMTADEKQKTKNEYKFIHFNIPNGDKIIDLKGIVMKIDNFNSNDELWRLLIENEACNEDYQRHFRLNKILK